MIWVLCVGGCLARVMCSHTGLEKGGIGFCSRVEFRGAGGGAQGAGGCAESVFLSLVSCSPHRDDNQLTSQCFKLSSLQRQISESP